MKIIASAALAAATLVLTVAVPASADGLGPMLQEGSRGASDPTPASSAPTTMEIDLSNAYEDPASEGALAHLANRILGG